MINSNENENDNGKRDLINKTLIDLDVDVKTNVQNIACLGKTMSLCNKPNHSHYGFVTMAKLKQHLRFK